MNRPWLDWSRRDFQKRMLPAVTLNFLAYWVVLPFVPSDAARVVLGLVLGIISVALLYVGFTWASAYDKKADS